jgi:tetratricopeptide (TPR) repeat protein
LAVLLEELKSIEGPKTVILLAGGFVVDKETTVLLDPLGWAAATAGVSLYSLQLESISADPIRTRTATTRLQDASVVTNGMATLAGMTRGALFRVGQAGTSVFERVEREIGGYYLLSFTPTLADRDGKPHEVVVRTRRDDVIVRSRTSFVIRKEARSTADVETERLKGLIKNPLPATDLPLKVSTYTARDPETSDPQVLVALEIGSQESPPGRATMALALLDEEGNVGAQKLLAASHVAGERSPLRSVTPIPAGLGSYTLKVAAIDDRGKLGSLEHPVRLQFASAGGLELSDLLISEPASGGAGTPLIASLSGNTGRLDMVLELYTEEQSLTEGTSVSFEVAKGEAAPQLLGSEAKVERTDQPRRWTAAGQLDLSTLEPSDYIARAVVSKDGGALAQVIRPFRLARKPPTIEAPTETPDVAIPSIGADLPAAYAKALDTYREGSHQKAIQSLSRMSPKTIEQAKQQLGTADLTDVQLNAVALIHTEVGLKTGRNEVVHLGVARELIERMSDASRKEALLKDWLLLMGYHLHGLYRDQDAISFLEAGLDLAPKDEEILMALGTVYEAFAWMVGNRHLAERAEDYYRKIVKANSDNVEARLRLGHVLKLKEKHKDALRELTWCLSHSEDPEIELVAHLLVGGLHEEYNELTKAVESYRAAFDLDPRCQVAAAALSYALHRSGDMTGSREVWVRFAQRADGSDGWLRYLHGSPEKIDSMLTRMRGEIQ